MKSPFPGMDPYLEQHWGDVHTRLIVYASNQINAQLPDDLQARVEESIAVEADDPPRRTVYPDVSVVEPPSVRETAAPALAVVTVAEPCVLLDDEPRTQRHIEIVNLRDGGRVITAIEVLSPANKVGQAGRSAYRKKQRDYLEAGINLVEIDLVRDGDFILAAVEHRIPPDYRTPYLVCIRRAVNRVKSKSTESRYANRCPTSPSRSDRPTATWSSNSSR